MMETTAVKFTPDVLLSSPRRSPAIPNSAGTRALHLVSTYSFESHSAKVETYITDLQSGKSTLFSDDPGNKEPNWIGDDGKILFRKEHPGGLTGLWIGDEDKPSQEPYLAGTIEAPVSSLKVKRLNRDTFVVLMVGLATSEGTLYNPEISIKYYSTGREYSSLPVRDWDQYVTSQRKSMWYLRLHKASSSNDNEEARYEFSTKGPINALYDTQIDFVPSSAATPTPGAPINYDLSTKGILFVGRKSAPDIYKSSKSDVLYIPLSTFTEDPAPRPRVIPTGNFGGKSSLPVFSRNGDTVAFLRTKDGQDLFGKYRILVVSNVLHSSTFIEIRPSLNGIGGWELSPEFLLWSNSGTELHVAATQRGRRKLFTFSTVQTSGRMSVPLHTLNSGSISSVSNYSTAESDSRLLVTTTSMIDSSTYSIVHPSRNTNSTLSSFSNNGSDFGLSPTQISEIIFQGGGNYDVHAWVIKPSNFQESKTYPLAVLVHGGPLAAWTDSWSTRWNPMVFAEQGYIVVLPNITGSTGYSQAFEDAVFGDWGGRPYHDLEQCFKYVKKNLSFVDTTRAVALGGSFGGYMIYWLAGQPLAKEFRALVSHDGIFSSRSLYSSDLPDEFNVLFGSHMWEEHPDRDNIFDKWDPARYTKNWTTPMLVIHSDRDFRCPISMGLAPFSVLQLKGVESKFLNFPDENHFVMKPENSLHWHRVVLGWINRFTGTSDSSVSTV